MNASVDYVFPEKYRILSGSALKMIAVHHHADRSYRSCAAQYVSARTENPVYAFRQRI